MTSPEVSNLTDQYVRIHDSLQAVGLLAHYVHNANDEPVAVMLPDAFDPRMVTTNLPLQRGMEAPYGPLGDDRRSLKDHFPLSGARIYPRHVLDIVDTACRAAAGTDEGLAHELKSPTDPDSRAIQPKGKGLGLHTDYAGTEVYVPEGLEMHGLNVHLTCYGSYVAELGIVRKLITDDDIETARDIAAENNRPRWAAFTAMYEELGAPFVKTPTMRQGDILIFQAQQHAERGIPAVAHNFVTTSNARRSDVLRPHLGHADEVGEERERLTTTYKLGKLGY